MPGVVLRPSVADAFSSRRTFATIASVAFATRPVGFFAAGFFAFAFAAAFFFGFAAAFAAAFFFGFAAAFVFFAGTLFAAFFFLAFAMSSSLFLDPESREARNHRWR